MTHSFPTRRSSVLRGEKAEILIYNTDDRTGGFVNESYPVTVEIGGSSYEFPVPSEQLAAVIIAEAYLREGNRRVKVANEGYTFGIEAFARARQFSVDDIPGRQRRDGNLKRWEGGERGGPSAPPGTSLGSGSGVLVAPGLVVTTAHLIAGGSNFKIARGGNHITMLALDPMHDLANLHGDADRITLH